MNSIESLLASHDVRLMTGDRLGGQALTIAIKAKIDRADALVALLTRREKLPKGKWRSHPWVQDELGYAKATNKPAIAFVEDGVAVEGAYANDERINYLPKDPLPAFLALSQTIGTWKSELGRFVKVRILPDLLAEKLSGDVKCQYRFINDGQPGEWRDTDLIGEVGGVFLYVKGVHDETLIRVRITVDDVSWQSLAIPSGWTSVELKQVANP